MSFLQNLGWRRAAKGFHKDADIPEEHLQAVQEAIRLAPTSFGISPFRVMVLARGAQKDALAPMCWNQAQIPTSSHLLVFISRADTDARIEEYVDMALQQGGNAEGLAKYAELIRGFLQGKTEDELHAWAARQAYIALGFAMAACAELQVESCPLEGFVPDQVASSLDLAPTERVAVMLALGARDQELTHRPSVHFPPEGIF